MSNDASIIVRDQEVRRLLARFSEVVKNPRAALSEIGEAGLSGIYDVFDDEGDPPGSWPELSDARKAQRKEAGKWPGKMLRVSGAAGGLLGSINYRTVTGGADGPKVVWGAKKAYARVHQYGYPPRHIPARPFMVLNRGTIDSIRRILIRRILEAL